MSWCNGYTIAIKMKIGNYEADQVCTLPITYTLMQGQMTRQGLNEMTQLLSAFLLSADLKDWRVWACTMAYSNEFHALILLGTNEL